MQKFHLISFILFIMTNTYASNQNLMQLLPDIPNGWSVVVEDKLYDSESLYEYINGGAELYLSYIMTEVASRIIGKGDMEIRIEIFDMNEPENAYGVFTHTRTNDEQKYGQGSQYFTGAQIFWKDKYYVALTANDENEEIKSTLGQLAEEIDKKISSTGSKPELLRALPDEGLVPFGFVYFKHYIWLNSYYYIASENILNINQETDAILAKYGTPEERFYLLVIKYPTEDDAQTALLNFRSELMEKEQEEVIQIEDKAWLGVKKTGNYLFAVFNAPQKNTATNLLEKTMVKLSETTP